MKKTSKSNLILLILITLLTLYLVNSKLIVSEVLDYTNLFITKLFPTSFLIYIISSLLVNYGLIDQLAMISRNPTTLYITLMSMISGFPSGPKYIKDLYTKKYINEATSNYLLTFTHFPNPLFILGSVSSIISLNNSIKILLSIILSNLLVAVLLRKNISKENLPIYHQESFSSCLATSIISSLKVLLLVYGTSLFFYLISLILVTYLSPTPLIYVLLNGFFDLTKGIFSTSLISSEITKSILIIIFITLGSISIHIQIKSILTDTNLNYNYFLLGRIISTIISIIIFLSLQII